MSEEGYVVVARADDEPAEPEEIQEPGPSVQREVIDGDTVMNPHDGNSQNVILRTTNRIFRKIRTLLKVAMDAIIQSSRDEDDVLSARHRGHAEPGRATLHSHDFPIIYYTPSEEGESTCAICNEFFVKDDKLRLLPCFHKYHRACADEWLDKSMTCPVCRKDMRDI